MPETVPLNGVSMILVSFGLAVMIVAIILRSRFRRAGGFAYIAGPGLLTAAERSAFGELVAAVGKDGHVCPKVRIADLVQVKSSFLSRRDWQTAFNRISQKHVDFVVIDRTGSTHFAVEVDDRSHDRSERRIRDAFVNDVFAMAGIELVRVRPGRLRQSHRLQSALDVLRGDRAVGEVVASASSQ